MLRPIALLLAAQSESGLCNLLKQLERLERLEQLIPPRIWIVLFTLLLVLWILKSLFKLFVFLINVGGQAASILSWLDVPSPFQRAQPYTNQLECNRKQLLTIVKKEVNRRLATSLHNLVKLDLYMEDQRQRVGSPKVERVPEDKPSNNEAGFWTTTINRFLRLKDKEKQSSRLKSTQKIIEVFEQPEISGKLLILGEPGSGKTTELLQLAQDLVTRVEQDDRQPVPVILELSSWDGESIDKWVASQLKKLYTVSEEITQQWLAVNQILLLLDGLDELGLLKQRQCIEKLNQFLESTYVSKLVVCCRREEYEAGEIELDGLNGAVYLEALREDQIRQYFEGLNRLSVWNNVSSNAVLLELAEKPLFMSMLVVAYQGNPIRNEQELFDAYIEKQLHEPRNQGTYKRGIELTPQETRHHLVWLAQQLESISETEFLIEGLQPTWLLSFRQKILYGLILGLANVLLFSLFLTLYYGLLVVGWGGSWNTLIILLRIGIILSLIMSGSFAFTITPIARMPWSFRGGLVGGFQLGICSAVLCGVTIGFSHGLNDALFAAGLFGLLFGLFGFLLIGDRKSVV